MDDDEPIHATLRHARTTARVSLDVLAARTNLSKSYLSRVETGRGRERVSLEICEAYDTALGTGGHLAALYTATAAGGTVRRRAILAAIHGITALAVTDPHLLGEALRVELLTRLGVDDWPDITDELGVRFCTDPPPVLRRQLAADLTVLGRHLQRDDPHAAAAAPRLMTLYALTAANVGELHTAGRWYRAARYAADAHGDPALQQWTRGREAFRRGYEGLGPVGVLQLAAGVDDIEAYLAVAQAYARLGEDRQALAAIDAARRAHDHTDQSETTIYAMPVWRMHLTVAYCYALLGDVDACEREAAAVAPPPVVQRWEHQRDITRAVAHTMGGDPAAGRDMAWELLHDVAEANQGIVVAGMRREATGPGRSIR